MVADEGRRRRPKSATARARSGWRATGPRASRVCSIAPRRRASVANRTDEQRVAGDRRVAAAAVHRPRDRRAARHGRSRRSRGSSRGSGWASSAGSGSSPPSATSAQRPGELIHIDVKKLGRIERRRRQAHHRRRQHYSRRLHRRGRHPPRHRRLGLRAHRHRRLHPPGLRRSPRRREGHHRDRLPAPRRRVLRAPRHHRRAAAHRQRLAPTARPSTRIACRALGIRHLRTRPYRPQTNGKAERFIRTMLGGWAYGAIYRHSTERTAALDGWLWHYNHHRRHSALGHKPPSPA